MKTWKMPKNYLDEMQEMKMLKIEHIGCWLAFWGLTLSIMLQAAFGGNDLKDTMGEAIVLFVLAAYLSIACIKNGIWDRRLKANPKTNLFLSLLTGGLTGAFWFVSTYIKYHFLFASILTFIFMMVFTSIFVMICLSIVSSIYNKRKQHMEALADEEEDSDEDVNI